MPFESTWVLRPVLRAARRVGQDAGVAVRVFVLMFVLAIITSVRADPTPNLGSTKLPTIEPAKSSAPLGGTWKTFESRGSTLGGEFTVDVPGVPAQSLFKIGAREATRLDLVVAPDVVY